MTDLDKENGAKSGKRTEGIARLPASSVLVDFAVVASKGVAMIIQYLWHFRGMKTGDMPNTEWHHGKHIGIHVDEASALASIRLLRDVEGFRDHPDGFHLFPIEVDRIYWSEGFTAGPKGLDIAIADDGTGIQGSDDGLVEYGNDEDRDEWLEEQVWTSKQVPDASDEFWELVHYKISALSSMAHEDMGHKFVGYFTTRARLEAAIRHLTTKPGFREWPDGFRITWEKLGGTAWQTGFGPS